ncbi:hypothetical protein [Maricaulis sp.]|uniref:hypothetical protein n=1 Tax=Maricaulis sp. TaxID=1486257 RepID=UPI003299394F
MDVIESVKEIARQFEAAATRAELDGEHEKAGRNQERFSALDQLIAEVEHLRDVTTPIPNDFAEDLSDIPRELLKELTLAKTDELEQQIHIVVQSAPDGQADIDTILIGLYRKFDVIQKRRFLQNKLWRMTQKGLLSSVRGKKGVYAVAGSETGSEVDSEQESDEGPDIDELLG